MISSQPRYDHFDISPSMLNPVVEYNDYSIFHRTGRPVMSCCGARNLLLADASPNFDRGHSFLLPSSATGGGRKRPHFDISPYMIKLKASLIFVSYPAGRPVMSCCGARNLLLADASPNFDRGHSALLASSDTVGARRRPHFDISPYYVAGKFGNGTIIPQKNA